MKLCRDNVLRLDNEDDENPQWNFAETSIPPRRRLPLLPRLELADIQVPVHVDNPQPIGPLSLRRRFQFKHIHFVTSEPVRIFILAFKYSPIQGPQ